MAPAVVAMGENRTVFCKDRLVLQFSSCKTRPENNAAAFSGFHSRRF